MPETRTRKVATKYEPEPFQKATSRRGAVSKKSATNSKGSRGGRGGTAESRGRGRRTAAKRKGRKNLEKEEHLVTNDPVLVPDLLPTPTPPAPSPAPAANTPSPPPAPVKSLPAEYSFKHDLLLVDSQSTKKGKAGDGTLASRTLIFGFQDLNVPDVSPPNSSFDPEEWFRFEKEEVQKYEWLHKISIERLSGTITIFHKGNKRAPDQNDFIKPEDWQQVGKVLMHKLRARKKDLEVSLVVRYKKTVQVSVWRVGDRGRPPVLDLDSDGDILMDGHETSDSENDKARSKYPNYRSPQKLTRRGGTTISLKKFPRSGGMELPSKSASSATTNLLPLGLDSALSPPSSSNTRSDPTAIRLFPLEPVPSRHSKTFKLIQGAEGFYRDNKEFIDMTASLTDSLICTSDGCGNKDGYCYVSRETRDKGSHYRVPAQDFGIWAQELEKGVSSIFPK